AYIYGTVPEAILEAYDTYHAGALKDLGNEAKAMIPNFLPTMFQAALRQAEGKDAFGAPIVPPGLENVKPQYQYKHTTPLWAREVGKVMGESPARIHQAWRDLTGNIGADIDSVVE